MNRGGPAVPAGTVAHPSTAAAVRRNVLLLTAGMAALYGMVELAAAVATLTFVAAGGSRDLAGLAPAAFLAAAALAALPAGRAMDRFGRTPILAGGFGVGVCGSSTAALGAFSEYLPAVVLGFVLVGASTGTVMLSRAAAADMYPPDRRAQGIALVLFGAVFGALLGPAVFIPLVSAGELGRSSLGPAWLGAAGFMAVGLALMGGVRPDPQEIGRSMAEPGQEAVRAASLRRILARPGVPPAVLAAVASWSAMVALMTLMGSALVAHDHPRTAIFPVLSAHFIGMFALFPLVGRAIDRLGRGRTLVSGLVLLGGSAMAVPAALRSVALSALALFGIGLGWSFAYVAATAELTEKATPAERAKLLGVSDSLSGLTGAGLTVLGGLLLATAGVTAVSLAAAGLTIGSGLWIAAVRSRVG